jgi:hypothetical protein
MRVHEIHQVLAFLVPAIGSDQQPARFIEGNQYIVFEKNRWEWHGENEGL